MLFQNETERMQHPQAKLIPISLWRDYNLFRERLNNNLISLMQEEKESLLLSQLKKYTAKSATRERQCAWIAITFSHPSFNEELLFTIAKTLELSNELLFQTSIALGNLSLVRALRTYLGPIAPTVISHSFRYTAKKGYLATLCYLGELDPKQIQAMIEENNYEAFRWAAQNGHLHVLEFLAEKIQPEKAQEMFSANHCEAYSLAVANGHLAILYFLEQHSPKDKIFSTQSSQLMELAVKGHHDSIVEHLLTFSEFFSPIEPHLVGQAGTLSLRDLAQDHESALAALSQGEKQRLKAVLNHYQPRLEQMGVIHCMTSLRSSLIKHYQKEPAFITISSNEQEKKLFLPVAWEEFQKIELTREQREEALRAYYQNRNHSALRYLSKPNPWLHPKAAYTQINPAEPDSKWSGFEEYQSLLCIFYLAAIDSETPAIDGYSLETRFEHFIRELAFLGRANNWEESRIKKDEGNYPLFDKYGNLQIEEHDDLEGDKPSCCSGVKRHLFQSVLGHPLLVFLTKEKMAQELNEFVWSHFQKQINLSNIPTIREAWKKFMGEEELTDQDWKTLKSLDINPEQQNVFRTAMQQKYKEQFSNDPLFEKLIDSAFSFRRAQDAHILNFGYLHPERLLTNTEALNSHPLSTGSIFCITKNKLHTASKKPYEGQQSIIRTM
jgi:hypothetical protein